MWFSVPTNWECSVSACCLVLSGMLKRTGFVSRLLLFASWNGKRDRSPFALSSDFVWVLVRCCKETYLVDHEGLRVALKCSCTSLQTSGSRVIVFFPAQRCLLPVYFAGSFLKMCFKSWSTYMRVNFAKWSEWCELVTVGSLYRSK